MNRREFLVATGLALAARAQSPPPVEEVRGGGLTIDVPQIAENGNSIPLRIRVASPMTAQDHVERIIVIAPRNPRPRVAVFHLEASSGRADISTRIRLAGTQVMTVRAELSGGRVLEKAQEVLVTLAACLDEASL